MIVSLEESNSINDTVNAIMLRTKSPTYSKQVFILLEGVDDVKLYQKFFNIDTTIMEYCHGRPNAIEILRKLNMANINAICICDSDFDKITNRRVIYDNLFFTDYHDIEMTMLFSNGILKNVLFEYSLQSQDQQILDNAIKESSYIGYIRLYNLIKGIELSFQGLGLGCCISIHDRIPKLKKGEYLNIINCRNGKRITCIDIFTFQNDYNKLNLYDLCSGHDVTAIIALIIGSHVSCKSFCTSLRNSFKLPDFKKTVLYHDINFWQISNHFNILLQ